MNDKTQEELEELERQLRVFTTQEVSSDARTLARRVADKLAKMQE